MTAAKEPVLSLHRKLAQVMYEAERIPKNGQAPKEMGGYKFVQVGDAADFIRKALAEKVITMMPTGVQVVGQVDRPTKSGGNMTTVDLLTEWTLTDGESGESITIMSFGSGADGGDKYSGKASTSAMKYALLTGFLLSTGEDSELTGAPSDAPVVSGGETLEFLGNLEKTGSITPGGAAAYKLEWRETPDGHAIGFRLKLADKDVPQVLVTGAIGTALHLAYPEGASLNGVHVSLKGRLHGVKAPGRATYFRLVVGEGASDFIETPDVRIPAPPSEPPAGVENQPDGSPIVPEAAYDAAERAAHRAAAALVGVESMTLPLDAEERALVGEGLPDA